MNGRFKRSIRHELFGIILLTLAVHVVVLLLAGSRLFELFYTASKSAELKSAARLIQKTCRDRPEDLFEVVNGVENRNTMTQIADALAIRVSSLTTAVNTLVRKGYLKRGGEPGDRRVIRVWLTPKGEEANRLHAQFHAKMVEEAASGLEAGELDTLLRSLRQLEHFFHDMSRQNQ